MWIGVNHDAWFLVITCPSYITKLFGTMTYHHDISYVMVTTNICHGDAAPWHMGHHDISGYVMVTTLKKTLNDISPWHIPVTMTYDNDISNDISARLDTVMTYGCTTIFYGAAQGRYMSWCHMSWWYVMVPYVMVCHMSWWYVISICH